MTALYTVRAARPQLDRVSRSDTVTQYAAPTSILLAVIDWRGLTLRDGIDIHADRPGMENKCCPNQDPFGRSSTGGG